MEQTYEYDTFLAGPAPAEDQTIRMASPVGPTFHKINLPMQADTWECVRHTFRSLPPFEVVERMIAAEGETCLGIYDAWDEEDSKNKGRVWSETFSNAAFEYRRSSMNNATRWQFTTPTSGRVVTILRWQRKYDCQPVMVLVVDFGTAGSQVAASQLIDRVRRYTTVAADCQIFGSIRLSDAEYHGHQMAFAVGVDVGASTNIYFQDASVSRSVRKFTPGNLIRQSPSERGAVWCFLDEENYIYGPYGLPIEEIG